MNYRGRKNANTLIDNFKMSFGKLYFKKNILFNHHSYQQKKLIKSRKTIVLLLKYNKKNKKLYNITSKNNNKQDLIQNSNYLYLNILYRLRNMYRL